MKTKTITLYSFDELSESAQQKAIELLYDINVDHEWWEFLYEDAERAGVKIEHFDERKIGVKFISGAEETAHYIIDNHGTETETYKDAEAYLSSRDNAIETAEKDEDGELVDESGLDDVLGELDCDFLKTLGEDYRIMLSKEYDYLTSKEQIIETIKANEYTFTEDGKLEN